MFTDLYATLSELVVGASTITALALVYWLCQGDGKFVDYFRGRAERLLYGPARTRSPSWRRWVRKREDSPPLRDSLYISILFPVLGALMLGLGLALQDAMDDAIDSHSVGAGALTSVVQYFLHTKDEYRLSALVRSSVHRQGWAKLLSIKVPPRCETLQSEGPQFTGLGYEVFVLAPELEGPILQKGISIEPHFNQSLLQGNLLLSRSGFLSDPERPPDDDLLNRCVLIRRIADALYYEGKNWALEREPTAGVLRRWGVEVNIVGCLAGLTFGILGSTLIYILVQSIRWIVRLCRRERHEPHEQHAGHERRERSRLWDEKMKSAAWWSGVSLGLCLFCAYNYVLGLRDYAERAIGMYVSAHSRGEIPTSIVGCEEIRQLLSERSTPVLNYQLPACVLAKSSASDSPRYPEESESSRSRGARDIQERSQ